MYAHAKRLLDGGTSPIVIFAHHDEVLRPLAAAFADDGLAVRLISGSLKTQRDRYDIVVSFAEGKIDVLLATFLTSREGLTLTRASHALIAERSWAPAYELQCEDRIYRIGQLHDCCITYFHAPGTVDEYFLRLVHDKDKRCAELFAHQLTRHDAALCCAVESDDGRIAASTPRLSNATFE